MKLKRRRKKKSYTPYIPKDQFEIDSMDLHNSNYWSDHRWDSWVVNNLPGIWLPYGILGIEEMAFNRRFILAVIFNLQTHHVNGFSYSTNTNSDIAKITQLSEKSISNHIKKLIERNYIQILKFEGNTRHMRTTLDPYGDPENE